jgi:apolipoprotein D and lipocalin family protein
MILNSKKMKKQLRKLLVFVMGFFTFNACANIPDGAVAVKPFDSERYLGKWYEIARFDFRFERGLNNTTATYSMNKNGSIRVENNGYDYTKKIWKKAVGKAKFIGSSNEARLKVSFFGPFYGGYNVIALDSAYKYALVAGDNLGYLWILSRETSIPENIKQSYLNLAQKIGFDTDKLIWVEHTTK